MCSACEESFRVEKSDGENGCYYIREGIIIVPKNAVIKDGTVV
jgi:hypothetical protein